jgi:hypothetical protein
MLPDKPLPKEAAYVDEISVFDCTKLISAQSETTLFSKSGEVLYHHKWADPQLLNLSFGYALTPGSVGLTARNIVCNEDLRTPLLSKKEMVEMRFNSLSSAVNDEAEIYYKSGNKQKTDQIQETFLITKFQKDRSLGEALQNNDLPDLPNFRLLASRVLLRCGENKAVITKADYYDNENKLVYLSGLLPSGELPWVEIKDQTSPFGLLYQIACGTNEVSK